MNKTKIPKRRESGFYIGVAIALLVCLWIGWSDFDPDIARPVVQENIRYGIRQAVQVSVQYIVPIGLVVLLASKALAGSRGR